MLQHLSHEGKQNHLNLYSYIWEYGVFPSQWCEATLVPILKPGQDKGDVSSYRPIALTSCLCKTLERMVNSRLL